MATGAEVLTFLRPDGGWVITGNDFDSIQWISANPVTKQEFEEGFAKADAWKVEKTAEAAAKRQTLLDKLGITEDEAKLLLGGN
jgi:hypothetical protein